MQVFIAGQKKTQLPKQKIVFNFHIKWKQGQFDTIEQQLSITVYYYLKIIMKTPSYENLNHGLATFPTSTKRQSTTSDDNILLPATANNINNHINTLNNTPTQYPSYRNNHGHKLNYNIPPNHNHSNSSNRNHHQNQQLGKSPTDIYQLQQYREDNARLKRQLKQMQAKRNASLKQSGQLVRKVEKLENQLYQANKKMRDIKQKQGDSTNHNYKVQQLHFLNKQLNNEVEMLRTQNQQLLEKVRYGTTVLQRKYQQLKQNTFKKNQSAIKRIKKAITYLNTLSPSEIHKTKNLLVQNLQKGLELLKGRYVDQGVEDQVTQLLNPLTSLKQQMNRKDKQIKNLKQKLEKVQQQFGSEQKLNRQVLPQYKETIEKLKKSLSFCRVQLADVQNDKNQIKRQYEQRIRILQQKNNDLTSKITKLKLQRKLYEQKIDQLQNQAEEQKERLIHQNQILKKLYNKSESETQQFQDFHKKVTKKQQYNANNYIQTNAQIPPLLSAQYRKAERYNHHQQSFNQSQNSRELQHPILNKYNSKASLLQELKRSISGENSAQKHKSRSRQRRVNSRQKQRSNSRNRRSIIQNSHGSDHGDTSKSQIKNEIQLIDQEIQQIQKCLNRELANFSPQQRNNDK